MTEMAKRIELVLHTDRLDDGSVVWWAESPQLPRFSATADSLQETIALSKHAILDALAEEGSPPVLEWRYTFAEPAHSEGPELRLREVAR